MDRSAYANVAGRWLVWIGAGALIAGMVLTPPWLTIGAGLGIVGLILGRGAGIGRDRVIACGAALSAWIALSMLVAWLSGRALSANPPGLLWYWLAIPVVAVAVANPVWRRLAFLALLVTSGLAVTLGILQFCFGTETGSWHKIRLATWREHLAAPVPGMAWLLFGVGAICAMVAGAWRPRRGFAGLAMVTALVAIMAGLAAWWIPVVATERGGLLGAGANFAKARGFTVLNLTYGFVFSLVLILALAQPVGWPRRIGVAFGAIGLAVSGARGAVLGALAGIAAWLGAWMAGGTARRLLIAGAILIGVGGLMAGALYLSSPRRFERMLAMENGRWPIWQASAQIVADHPLTGVGDRAQFQRHYPAAYQAIGTTTPDEFAGRGAPHAHHAWLAAAAEHGIPAAVLHLLLIGAIVWACWRRRREQPIAWRTACAVAAAGLVAGQFEPYPSQAIPGLAWHACLGFAWGLSRLPDADAIEES